MQKKERIFNFYKIFVALIGATVFAFATEKVNVEIFDWRFAGFIILTVLVASRMPLTLPRSKIVLSFSDSLIFLTFLFYGGETAICIAALEMFSGCLFQKYAGFNFSRFSIPFNIGSTILSTAFTYCVWYLLSAILGIARNHSDAASLVSMLGILALAHFFSSSVFAAVFYSLKTGNSAWKLWKNEFYSISLTQIIGAGAAGIVYKLVLFENVGIIAICLILFAVIYFTYRRSNRDLESSMAKTRQAEREIAEAERVRLEQAIKHADELQIRLDNEEMLSEELQESKDEIEYASIHDALTDVYNRPYFIERLRLLFQLEIHKSNRYFILLFNLSRFKNINDGLGHDVGDKVLKLVTLRLRRIVHAEDTVTRIGGDEFAVILNDLSSVEEAEEYARRITEKLSQPFAVQGNRIFTKPHIGIVPLDETYITPEEVLRDADIAMHYSRRNETGATVFTTEIRDLFLERVNLESDLRFAVERREFSMNYQPLVSLSDGTIIGFEALLRWRHPKRGLVPPVEFIPIAEDSGLIIPITEWILRETTAQLAAWQKIAPVYRDLIMSVNISGRHLEQDGLIEEVEKVVRASGIEPHCLKLEITESVAMENAERTIAILSKLKEIGVQLSIDDFGTGYSSLSYLHRLPFDTLKIDRSFVKIVGERGENSEILQTIIHLAKNLKMRSIAEGIETESQLQILQNLNCDFAQGYLFSKPLPKDEMEIRLYQNQNWFPNSFIPQDLGILDRVEDSPSTNRLYVF